MSISGDSRIVVLGAPGENNNVGAAWVFLYDGSAYEQLGNKLTALTSSQQGKRGAKYVSINADATRS